MKRDSAGPKVVVIGSGAWGRNLARCFAELDALVAVVDSDPLTATETAARHGCAVRDFDAVLADPAVDAVVVATPPRHHPAAIRAALAAGKHVLVEKPLALDIATARALVAQARAAGRVLMTGHILRHHPAFAELERRVHAGEFGRIRRILATRFNLGAIRRDEDALWCLAPHDVSMVLALSGERPETVSAFGDFILRDSIADAATLRLVFPSGDSALIEVSWLHPVKEQRLVVIGTRGMAIFDDTLPWDHKLTLYPHRITASLRPEAAEPVPVPLEPAEPLLDECRHFLDRVRDGREPLTGSAEALAVMEVLDRAARAMRAPELETTAR